MFNNDNKHDTTVNNNNNNNPKRCDKIHSLHKINTPFLPST